MVRGQKAALVVHDSPSVAKVFEFGFELISCLLVVLSLGVFPLFRGGTLTYVWLYAAAALSFALAILLIARALGSRPIRASTLARSVALLVVAQLCWIIIRSFVPSSTFASVLGNSPTLLAPEAVVEYVLKHCFYLLVFIWAYIYVNSRSRLSWLVWFVLLITVCQALIGIMASKLGVHLVPSEYLDGHWSFARGTFINRNHYAALLGIGISLCGASFMAVANIGNALGEQGTGKAASSSLVRSIKYMFKEGGLLFVFLCVLLFGVLLSESRGGFIAPFISLSLLGLFLFRGVKLLQFFAGIIGLVVIIYVSSLILGESDSLINRFVSLYENSGRVFIWQAILPMAADNWFWGVGVGGFFANFELYRPADFSQWQLPHAHSEYLHLFIEQGVIGLILWVLPIIVVLRSLLRKVKTTRSSYARKMCLLCAAVIGTLSLHSVWEVHLQQPAISVYFYVFLALGIVSTEMNRKSKSARV